MTVTIEVAILLLVAHFIGDFVCQTDRMAIQKSSRWDALADHVVVYGLVLGAGVYGYLHAVASIDLLGYKVLIFTCGNMGIHFVQDAITSRITSRLWFFRPLGQGNNTWEQAGGNRHWFFVTIGVDQLLHLIALLVSGAAWLR